jgi:prepilin-type N-terminal cleavage/methylation domain-containing protein/prepilin-type processing-associated H-X9-DG protein
VRKATRLVGATGAKVPHRKGATGGLSASVSEEPEPPHVDLSRSIQENDMTRTRKPKHAFTLIELLVVVSIISLLISILMPSLSRARDQSKGVHCLARLGDMARAFAAYENDSEDILPPAAWSPSTENESIVYGWSEIIFRYIYKERVYRPEDTLQESFPVQRNIPPGRWYKYFQCKASRFTGTNSGHYRVYLPSWLMGTFTLDADRRYDVANTVLNPWLASSRSQILPRMPLIGDSNEQSERIDTSYVDAGEANVAGSAGYNGNRFSDRHYGGTNFMYQDFHAERTSHQYRSRLATDVDLNGVVDVELAP